MKKAPNFTLFGLPWQVTRNIFARLILYAFSKVGIRFTKVIIYAINIQQRTTLRKSPGIISLKVCAKEDLSKMLNQKSALAFEKWIDNGRIMVGATIGERLVGYSWLSLQEAHIPEIEQYAHFDGAYIWNVYTSPDLRRRGIARQLIAKSLEIATERYQVENAYAVVVANNMPSRKAFEAVGFKPQKLVCFKKFLWIRGYKEEDLENVTNTPYPVLTPCH